MRIRSSPTPNPNSLKFEVSDAQIIEAGLHAFHSAREAADHPLGAELFSLPGVHSLMIVPDFVTVTKHPAADWTQLAEGVERVLRDHLGG
ncbi:MAG: NifU N-terminal domain-containing protein [Bacteroidota bacterium]